MNPDFVILLVSAAPVQYGVSRMWQTLVEDTGLRTEQFSDRPSADAWLEKYLSGSGDDN